MELSRAQQILNDKRSSDLERQIAENELKRIGFFSNLNLNLLPDQIMFLEIPINPNILTAVSSSELTPLTINYRYNMIYVLGFDFGEYNRNRGFNLPSGSQFVKISHYIPNDQFRSETSLFYFVENYLEFLEENRRISEEATGEPFPVSSSFREFATGKQWDSGLDVYRRIEKILRSQVLSGE